MTHRIDCRELQEWLAFASIRGPIGGRRDDLLTGILASQITNLIRGLAGGEANALPIDFMPFATRPQAEPSSQSVAEQQEAARLLTQLLGGKNGDNPQP